jgi:hypothetical protein
MEHLQLPGHNSMHQVHCRSVYLQRLVNWPCFSELQCYLIFPPIELFQTIHQLTTLFHSGPMTFGSGLNIQPISAENKMSIYTQESKHHSGTKSSNICIHYKKQSRVCAHYNPVEDYSFRDTNCRPRRAVWPTPAAMFSAQHLLH